MLMNVALHGMEQAAGVRYIPTGSNAGTARPGSPVAIRYADDLLALCHSREQAEQVKARLAAWLAPRGLVFNEDKTRIVHLQVGELAGVSDDRWAKRILGVLPQHRGELAGHLEIEDVTGVVLDDVEDPGPAVDGLGGL